MAQNDVRASELTSQAVGQGEHAIESAVGGTAEVLGSVEAGQRAAIEAVRGFVDTLDSTLAVRGEDASRPSRSSTLASRWPTAWSRGSTVSCAASCTPPVRW